MLDLLVDRVRCSMVFKRNKVCLEVKVIAALLYFSGLSYRRIASLGGFSYEAVRLWYRALNDAKPERKHHRCIAVDETKLGKEQVYIWAARDVDTIRF